MSRAGSLRVRDGTRISWSVAGRGPWLVLSHSLASDRGMWRPQLAALQARFTVLGYDTRGHGQSSVSADGFGFDTLAADVVALMDHLGVERARFMGLSMGGMSGLALALAHPERVERVVCCDARADAPDGFRAMWDDNIALLASGGMDAVAERTIPRWFSPAFRADPANCTVAGLGSGDDPANAARGLPQGGALPADARPVAVARSESGCPCTSSWANWTPGLPCRWSGTWPPAFPGQRCTSFRGPRICPTWKAPMRFLRRH